MAKNYSAVNYSVKTDAWQFEPEAREEREEFSTMRTSQRLQRLPQQCICNASCRRRHVINPQGLPQRNVFPPEYAEADSTRLTCLLRGT